MSDPFPNPRSPASGDGLPDDWGAPRWGAPPTPPQQPARTAGADLRGDDGSRGWTGEASEGVSPGPWRASQARTAMLFSALGLVCCGVPAMIGVLMALVEIRAMHRGATDPADIGTARGALLLGSFATALWLAGVLFWVVAATATMGG